MKQPYFAPEWRLGAHAQEVDQEFPVSEVDVPPDAVKDAGVDNRIEYSVRHGFRLWRDARIAYARAVVLNALDAAHEQLVEPLGVAVSKAASASYWLGDTPWLSDVHFDMDRMGQFRRDVLPEECALHCDGSRYENRCPIAIAHKRFGLSPAMVVPRMECSLCSQDISECPHLPGRRYRVRGGAAGSPTGSCRVCGQGSCDHSPATTYLTVRVAVVKEVQEIKEVSLVSAPKQPEARLAAVPVSAAALAESPGGLTPGKEIICDKCILPCRGFDYLPSREDEMADVKTGEID